jgi:hypothetical protein
LIYGLLVWISISSLQKEAVAANSTGSRLRPADGFRRGVVVSCPRAGQIWGSPEMAKTLQELASLGVDWISIHPYAGVRRDGSIRFRPTSETLYLSKAVDLVDSAGKKLFWKPHLAYWGNFEWRGAIDFGDDDQAWRRFFDGYRSFIVDQAAFAEQSRVELFSVGVEYEGTTRFESDWRRVIDAVRQVYSGKITYAANWDSLDKVPFWDALDMIGVNAYFPLSDRSTPGRDELWEAWDGPLEKLRSLSLDHGGKPVLFAEIGYSRSPEAALRPWVPENQDSPSTRALRKDLIDVALRRIEATPFVVGMFWWKWIPGNDRWDRDFSMKDPEARQPLEEWWGNTGPLLTK